MTNKYVCVYDFDSPLFAAAAIGDVQFIKVQHKKSGNVKEFKNITEFWGRGKVIGGWLAKQSGNWKKSDFIIKKYTKRNHMISMSLLQKMLISKIEFIQNKDFCDSLKLVVAGEGNYRYDIYAHYKCSRQHLPRPTQLQVLKDWLCTLDYDVIQENGIEADDVLGIWAKRGYDKALQSGNYEDNDICSVFIDKDILQFPGWYYNPQKKTRVPVWQTEIDAARCFWKQMLVGDKSDDIPGLPNVTKKVWKGHDLKGSGGIGSVRANVLLASCKSSKDMEDKVVYLYRTYYDSISIPWQEKFQLNYQLLKLQEQPGVIPKYNF